MTTVVFNRAGDRYTVEFAYNPILVEVLKAAVPSYARSWDKTTKRWLVDDAWAKPLATTLRATGCLVVGIDETPRKSCDSWAASLFRAVGERRIPAVHRALSRILHPDNPDTGSAQLQRQLNDARAELENH
jgi:hypothetical protein